MEKKYRTKSVSNGSHLLPIDIFVSINYSLCKYITVLLRFIWLHVHICSLTFWPHCLVVVCSPLGILGLELAWASSQVDKFLRTSLFTECLVSILLCDTTFVHDGCVRLSDWLQQTALVFPRLTGFHLPNAIQHVAVLDIHEFVLLGCLAHWTTGLNWRSSC